MSNDLSNHNNEIRLQASEALEAIEILKMKQQKDKSNRKWLVVFLIIGLVLFSTIAFIFMNKQIRESNYIANHCNSPAGLSNQWYNGGDTAGIQKELSMSNPGTIHDTLGDQGFPDSIRIRFEGKEGDRIRLLSSDAGISFGLADPSNQMIQTWYFYSDPPNSSNQTTNLWHYTGAPQNSSPDFITLNCNGTYYIYVGGPYGGRFSISLEKE